MNVFLSIIVPVYNTEHFLPRCVDSVLSQSFTDFELLLVDDGSTDGSGKICDNYAAKDSRVRVFHKENGGVSSARNVGLDNARGEWACFVDSDDELIPKGLEVMVEGASGNVSLVMAGYKVFDDNGYLTYSIEIRKTCCLNKDLVLKEMYVPLDYIYQGYIWNKLIRLSEVRKNEIRFSEDIFFDEDRLFLVEYICAMEKDVFYTTQPVYMYYEREAGAMMSIRNGFNPKFVSNMEAQIRMQKKVREGIENLELRELADFEVYKCYRKIIGLMRKFHYNKGKIRASLHRQLIDAIGIKTYLLFELRRNKKRVKKIICR